MVEDTSVHTTHVRRKRDIQLALCHLNMNYQNLISTNFFTTPKQSDSTTDADLFHPAIKRTLRYPRLFTRISLDKLLHYVKLGRIHC